MSGTTIRRVLFFGPLILFVVVPSIVLGDDSSDSFVVPTGFPHSRVYCPPCPCPVPAPSAEQAPSPPAAGQQPSPAAKTPGTAAPSAAAPEAAVSQLSPNDLGRGEAVASAAQSFAPTMIGDFFAGGGGGRLFLTYNSSNNAVPNPSPGAFVPTFKMAENTSPLPQDRIYFDYSDYSDVPLSSPGISVNSFTPGFEKTFFDGLMSFELRVPMAESLSHVVYTGGAPTGDTAQIGDVAFAIKGLLFRRDTFALSGGLAMSVPTAGGTSVSSLPIDPSPYLIFTHESTHLMPFLGTLWTPNESLFAISYLQVDVDVNGDLVSYSPTPLTPFAPVGRYRDQTFMYIDTSIGYWLFRDEERGRLVTGFAPVFEVHVNQSLEPSHVLAVPGSDVKVGGNAGGIPSNISIVDLTAGFDTKLGKNAMLTTAYCVPVTTDRCFDGQLRVFFNYFF